MAAIDVLNMSNGDHQSTSSTSSELLQSMVAGAVARTHSPNYPIKLEPDENDGEVIVEEFGLEPNASTSFMNSVTNSLFPPYKLNSESPLITTNGIARIPTESNSPSSSRKHSADKDPKPLGYMQQLKQSRTRIFHNPASKNQPLSISRPSNRYVHVEWTVHVPRTCELSRSNSAGAKSPPTSPLVHSNKRSPSINFATWLSEHFKWNGQQQGKIQQFLPTPHPPVNSSPLKHPIQKEPSSSTTKPLQSLPNFLIQFANKHAKMPTSGLISAARTVEIPTNDETNATNAQKQLDIQLNSRKSQRLLEKTEELRNRQAAIGAQPTDRQYKELKGELARIRKQMSRDRRRLMDECQQVRQEFALLRQIILDAIKLPQFQTEQSSTSTLNGKRQCSEDLEHKDEPSSKRHC